MGKCEIFKSFRGSAPDPAGGLQRPPHPQLEKGRAAHGLSCFARLTIVLLFTFFVLRPDQFLFRCYGPAIDWKKMPFLSTVPVYRYRTIDWIENYRLTIEVAVPVYRSCLTENYRLTIEIAVPVYRSCLTVPVNSRGLRCVCQSISILEIEKVGLGTTVEYTERKFKTKA